MMQARQRSGQYTLLEQIILFAAGITIAFGFLVAFRGLGENVRTNAVDVQADLVGRYMASTVVTMVESGGEGYMRFDPPDTIGDQGYAMELEDGTLTVVTRGEERELSAYGLLSRYDHGGRVGPRDREARIIFEEDQIVVEGE